MKHNLAKERPSRELLARLIEEQGLENVISTRSPAFKERGLDVAKLSSRQAIELMLEEPNLMRRPLLLGPEAVFGYDAAKYASLGGSESRPASRSSSRRGEGGGKKG